MTEPTRIKVTGLHETIASAIEKCPAHVEHISVTLDAQRDGMKVRMVVFDPEKNKRCIYTETSDEAMPFIQALWVGLTNSALRTFEVTINTDSYEWRVSGMAKTPTPDGESNET